MGGWSPYVPCEALSDYACGAIRPVARVLASESVGMSFHWTLPPVPGPASSSSGCSFGLGLDLVARFADGGQVAQVVRAALGHGGDVIGCRCYARACWAGDIAAVFITGEDFSFARLPVARFVVGLLAAHQRPTS